MSNAEKVLAIIATIVVISILVVGIWWLHLPIAQVDGDGNVKAVCTRDGLVHPPAYVKQCRWYDTEPVDQWYVPKFTAP